MSAANLSFAPASSISAGDVSCGQLNVTLQPGATANPSFQLVNSASALPLWNVTALGATTGGNAGGDLVVSSYDDSGAPLTTAARCARAGPWSFYTPVSMAGNGLTGLLSLSGADQWGLQVSGVRIRLIQTATGRAGQFVATNAVPLLVSCVSIASADVVVLTCQRPSGVNAGQAYVSGVSLGVGFNVVSGADDTSTYSYCILSTT